MNFRKVDKVENHGTVQAHTLLVIFGQGIIGQADQIAGFRLVIAAPDNDWDVSLSLQCNVQPCSIQICREKVYICRLDPYHNNGMKTINMAQ